MGRRLDGAVAGVRPQPNDAPVVDTAIGLTSRVQFGASVPRVAGSLGTMFFSTKVAVFSDDVRALKVAVGPTLEVLTSATLPGQRRTEWGVPVSGQIDRGSSRIYGGTGYFSPGIWYAGAGIGRSVSDRIGISISFSHAWARRRRRQLKSRVWRGLAGMS